MQVMFNVTNPLAEGADHDQGEDKAKVVASRSFWSGRGFRSLGGSVFCAGGAGSGDDGGACCGEGRAHRGPAWLSQRLLQRALITRVGTLELRVPQDRAGRFSTELFERYQRSEKALVGTLAEMYVQGVSTRKVKAVTEALCGHSFSASSISAINKSLDGSLRAFSERRLSEPIPI